MKAISQQWERRYSMWNLNRVLLFVASLVMVIALSMSMANAEEQKTYTLTEVKIIYGKERKVHHVFGSGDG